MFVIAYLSFFAVLFASGAWIATAVGRRVRPEWRLRAKVLVWLAVLAIPFWDLIPAKVYFYAVCRDAGVEILDKSLGKEAYLPALNPNLWDYNHAKTTALPWDIKRTEHSYIHPETGKPIMRYRHYGTHVGWDGFWKPWLAGVCPGPINGGTATQNKLVAQKIDEMHR